MRARTPERQRAALAISFVALAAGWAVLASPWLSGRVVIPYDAKAHFLPQLQFLAASWANGESAAWAPYVFSGHPQIADPQSLMFSPPFALLAWVNPAPTAWAADVTLFAMILAGAAAMLVWLNDKGCHPAAATLAALSFAFGAAMAWRVQHVGQALSLSYLPIVLLFLDRALDRRSIACGAAAGLSAAFLVLGRDQVALICVYLLIAHVVVRLVRERSAWRSMAGPLVAAGFIGAAAIAVPIVLTVLVAADSNRPQIDLDGAGRGSLHPALLLSLFSADAFGASGNAGEYWGPPSFRWKDTGLYIAQNMGQLYLGALPALALVWGVASGALWRRDIRLYSIALAVATVYALGWYTPGFRSFHALAPGVDLFRRPADAAFLIGFLASVTAGYAFNVWLREATALARRPLAIALAVVLAAFSTLAALAGRFDVLQGAWPTFAMSAALFAIAGAVAFGARALAAVSPALATLLVAAAITSDLAWSNRPGGATGLPPATYSVLDLSSDNDTIALVKSRLAATASDIRRERAEVVGFGFHWPNAALTHQIETTLGYNPLRLGDYARATGAGDHVGLPDQKQFSALYPGYRSTLAKMLGISTIATSVPIEEIDASLEPGEVTLVARTREGYVYDNPGAFPRVAFSTRAVAADFESLIGSGRWPDVDFTTTVLLEEAPISGAERQPGVAKIVSYANDRVTIDVDSPDGGWVVLYDIWHPWWFASIDGAGAPLLRANGLFRAVAAPPGRHTISLTFEPIRGAMRQLAGSR